MIKTFIWKSSNNNQAPNIETVKEKNMPRCQKKTPLILKRYKTN